MLRITHPLKFYLRNAYDLLFVVFRTFSTLTHAAVCHIGSLERLLIFHNCEYLFSSLFLSFFTHQLVFKDTSFFISIKVMIQIYNTGKITHYSTTRMILQGANN